MGLVAGSIVQDVCSHGSLEDLLAVRLRVVAITAYHISCSADIGPNMAELESLEVAAQHGANQALQKDGNSVGV